MKVNNSEVTDTLYGVLQNFTLRKKEKPEAREGCARVQATQMVFATVGNLVLAASANVSQQRQLLHEFSVPH